MADNNSQDIQRERFQRRFNEREQQQGNLGNVAVFGALTAAGVMFAGRSGALNRLGRVISEEGGAIVKAAKETMDNAAPIRRLDSQSFRQRMKDIRKEYESRGRDFQQRYDSYRRINKEAGSQQKMLLNRDRDVSTWLRDLNVIVGDHKQSLRQQEGTIKKAYEDQYRHRRIVQEMQTSTQAAVKANQEHMIAAINEMSPFMLGRENNSDLIFKHFEKRNFTNQQAIAEFQKIQQRVNQEMRTSKVQEDMEEFYQATRKRIQKEGIDQIVETESIRKNAVARHITGQKHLTVGDVMRLHKKGKVEVDQQTMANMMEAIKINRKFENVVYDKQMYIKGDRIEDWNVFRDVRHKFMDWYSNSMPGGIVQMRTRLDIERARRYNSFHVFERGTRQPHLSGYLGGESDDLLGQHFVNLKGKVFRMTDAETMMDSSKKIEALNDNRILLISSEYGSFGKMMRRMAGIQTPYKERNKVMTFLDLGNQDKESLFNETISRFKKFTDPKWDRRWIHGLEKHGIKSAGEAHELRAYLSLNSLGMTPRTFNNLGDEATDFVKQFTDPDKFNFSNEQHRLDLFKTIGSYVEKKDPGLMTIMEKNIYDKYRKFQQNPEKFMMRTTPIGQPDMLLGHATRVRTGMDEIDQSLSNYMLDGMITKRTLQDVSTNYFEQAEGMRSMFKQWEKDGFMNRRDLQHAEESLNYTLFSRKFHESAQDDAVIMQNINELLSNSEGLNQSLQKMARRTNPLYEAVSSRQPENLIGDNFVAIGEARGLSDIFGAFGTSGHLTLGERFKLGASPVTQMLAGRSNMQDVTTATMSGYYMAHRLEQMINSIGLGFSDDSMKSIASVTGNLFVKRLLPPVLAYEAFQYGDYLWDSITGAGFTERYENMKANQMLDKVANMSMQEKYEQQRLRQLKPGLENLAAMPGLSLPIAGRVGVGELLNRALSNPITGGYVDLDERTDMTYQEAMDDLYYGTEAVRKGRWWAMGSTTAYKGGRIDYFKPNSFRMAHSDWEDAGVGLTRKEYWSHHMLPNLHNPLGGLSYIVGLRDPYYFEKKHYEDRPFLLTGELFNPNTMLFGDIGNMTIGRMIKPVREMHEEYWSQPFMQTADQQPNGETPPAPVHHAYKLSPGAGLMKEGTTFAGLPTPEGYQPEPTYGPRKLQEKLADAATAGTPSLAASEEPISYNWLKRAVVRSNKLDNEGQETGDFIIHDVSRGKSVYVPTRINMDDRSYDDLINEAYEVEPEKFLSSGRLGVLIKGVNDILGINSPMSGLFGTAPMEMVMGNTYVEMMNHRDTMRAVQYDEATLQQLQANTDQMAAQVGGTIAAGEYDPRAREAVAMGMIDPASAPHSGWIDTNTRPQMQQPMDVVDPRSMGWKAQEMFENWTEPFGVYKWILNDEVLGINPYQGKAVIQQADYATSLSAKFWESNIGSLGASFSEFARRFMRPYDGQVEYYNPIRNTMPEWMPGSNYMIDFKTGDPYSKIDGGEYRLPGGAYERLNDLHSDHFGRYGAFDRFKILADVAPWSDEYEMWSDYVQEYVKDPKLRKQAEQIRKQASARKTKYEFQEYRFKDNDVAWQDAKIAAFVDDYRFMIHGSDDIYTLAGVNTRANADGVMQQYFKVGDVVRIGVAADESRRRKQDTNDTIGAVVQTALGNVNRDIIQRGLMKENMNDFSAAGVQARFSQKEISQGKRWETMAHYPSIFNTKFMPVRTALEEYERYQVYGKDWATWENFMWSDYIQPFFDGLGRYANPLMNAGAAVTGGAILGRAFLPHNARKPFLALTVGYAGLKYGKNMFDIATTGRADIPERRKREAEINEYYDVLKYMKYEGMYQKAREEILHRSGIDVEQVFNDLEVMQEKMKRGQKKMEKERKRLYKSQQQQEGIIDPTLQRTMMYDHEKGELIKINEDATSAYWKRQRKALNQEINKMKERLPRIIVSPDIQQALEYRQKRDQTIYNLDLSQTNADLAKAFPHKDRYFFEAFSKATEKEKKRLRQILPEYQLEAYERIWAGERDANPADYRKPLEYYEQKYGLPDWRWAGWRPDVDLDHIKMQTVAAEGLDLTDFGFWEADLDKASYAPTLGSTGSNVLEAPKTFAGYTKFRQNLQNILEGAGLWDVNVTVIPVDKKMTNVTVIYEQDRSLEVQAGMAKEMYNS